MKHISFKNIIAATAAVLALSACYDDKGNYDYSEIPEISIEGIPEKVTAIQKVDSIQINPVIKSSIEGVIDEKNPNFEFGCSILTKSGVFSDNSRKHDINPDGKKSFTFKPDENTGSYLLWYTVTDKRTGVTTNFSSELEITSGTYKGWLVLCDEGNDDKVRLDLLSDLGNNREAIVYDVMGKEAPVRHHANRVSMYDYYTTYQSIIVSSKEGCSYLDVNTLKTNESLDAKYQFIVEPKGETIILGQTHGYYVNNMITDKGNVYCKGYSYGSVFEDPCNTSKPGGKPEFKIAPMIGAVPGGVAGTYITIFYDTDNNRFLGRYIYASGNTALYLPALNDAAQPDPADNITRMCFMEGTWFSNGTVYSVLENAAGDRYVVGINNSASVYSVANVTKSYDKKITAAGFNKAKFYAFHSQYPYCFYEDGNNIKAYNLMTENLQDALVVPSNEEITMVKCNLLVKDFSSTDPALAATDYAVMIGSYDKSDPVYGGVLRIYSVDTDGKFTLLKEHKGFAKIRDVIYRER